MKNFKSIIFLMSKLRNHTKHLMKNLISIKYLTTNYKQQKASYKELKIDKIFKN